MEKEGAKEGLPTVLLEAKRDEKRGTDPGGNKRLYLKTFFGSCSSRTVFFVVSPAAGVVALMNL